ncbi:PLP-dependent aminotransferase family protein [Spongiibacter sp. KMU-158]|uniref:PLP-dependent aminotransferase family protein n=1 Tax=Spongiibacter pelagi TaxID=2760804 RepID=A0A927GUT7_9GAMM|nr:PLP-dependent aminotransferase family protein [Spongiibacter pelagi]MBD2857941.1 PLP-dependent aminotransferase family protein [Spongiibacter pelagi]
MSEQLIHIEFDASRTLNEQVREHLVDMIVAGRIPVDIPLPSSRNMAKMLGISRNTVMQVYEDLVDMEYLTAAPRQGYFVNKDAQTCKMKSEHIQVDNANSERLVDWDKRFNTRPGNKKNIVKPSNWARFEYPFIYGQVDPQLFPENSWRECGYMALSGYKSKHWSHDWVDGDYCLLVDQLRSKILPRRGIFAETSEILVTIGTQNSLYILANLLMNKDTKVGVEDPGFPDARNIFSTFNADIRFLPVDEEGLKVDAESEKALSELDYLYITPSHQVPTGAVLSSARRAKLLELAEKHDFVLIEDDYDAEINLQANVQPALRAADRNNRVIYIGSMSKSIAPGLRLGFMVADEDLIYEARSLRRLMYRHVPVLNQRQLALFFSRGYYDNYLRKLREHYEQKLSLMKEGIAEHLPDFFQQSSTSGATSIWLKGPEGFDTEQLAWKAAKNGILIEPGSIHFAEGQPKNYLRLGFSAIQSEKINPGLQLLGKLID